MRLVLSGVALALVAHAHAQAQDARFGWFGSLVGSCWVGSFPDGMTSHTHCYTVQFDKFIRGTASLAVQREGQSHRTFEGDSVFAWNESKQRIIYYIWGSDGSHRQLEAQFIGEELAFPVSSRKDPNQVAYRSVWRRLGNDAFEVRRERPSGMGWSTELTVVYRRAPSSGEDRTK